MKRIAAIAALAVLAYLALTAWSFRVMAEPAPRDVDAAWGDL